MKYGYALAAGLFLLAGVMLAASFHDPTRLVGGLACFAGAGVCFARAGL